MLSVMAGYDRLDITSVEQISKEDYLGEIKRPVSGFRLGTRSAISIIWIPKLAQAVEEATVLLAKMTKGAKEVALPPVTALPNLANSAKRSRTTRIHQTRAWEIYVAGSGDVGSATRDTAKARITFERSGRWKVCAAPSTMHSPISIWLVLDAAHSAAATR